MQNTLGNEDPILSHRKGHLKGGHFTFETKLGFALNVTGLVNVDKNTERSQYKCKDCSKPKNKPEADTMEKENDSFSDTGDLLRFHRFSGLQIL